MILKKITEVATSPRTSVALLCVLATLLFLNVALPQERVIGEERFTEIANQGPVARFILVTLGLGNMSISPVFMVFLGLFFAHLSLVLIKRGKVTVRRIRVRPPSRKTLQSWTDGEKSLRGTSSKEFDRRHVLAVLKGFGYRAVPAADDAVWSVKHRTAPLGFLLFHLSFFLICLGGAAIYYTRFVGTVRMVEGQAFTGFTSIVRKAPIAGSPPITFTVLEADAGFEDGEPVHLSASFRLRGTRGAIVAQSSINDPARQGSTSIMVNQAGVAPKLWLQDLQGFTIDRMFVAASTLSGSPTVVSFGGGEWEIELRPLVDRTTFPDRSGLRQTEVALSVRRDRETVYTGTLRPGEEAELGTAVLVLEDIVYWVGLYVVSERGGSMLVLGFILGTVGLVWRLMLYRREVAVVWDRESFAVAGRAEYFSNRFNEELETIRSFLERGSSA